MASIKSHRIKIYAKLLDEKYYPVGKGVESLSLATSNETTERAVIYYENPISDVTSGGITATISSTVDHADMWAQEMFQNEALGIVDKDYDVIQVYEDLIKDSATKTTFMCKKYKSKLPVNELGLTGGANVNLSVALASSGDVVPGYVDQANAGYDAETDTFTDVIYSVNADKTRGVFAFEASEATPANVQSSSSNPVADLEA